MKVIIICPKCNGNGRVSASLVFIKYYKTCPRCKGKGKIKHWISEHQRA